MSGRVAIDGHPGFYRQSTGVAFRVRDRRGRMRWHSARTIREAERERIRLEDAVQRGDYTAASQERFGEYARSWIDSYTGRTARGIQHHTREEYRKRLERDAIPFFGQMRLSEIEPRDVKAYVAQLSTRTAAGGTEPIKRDTVRLGVAPVKALLATAYEEGLIRSDPAAGLRLTVLQQQATPAADEDGDGDDDVEQVKALSETELRALLAALPDEWRLFHRFLAQTGLRIGEAIELRWKDIDVDARTLQVRRRFNPKARPQVGQPKSRYSRRRLRLTPQTAGELRLLRAGAGDGELVFTTGAGTRIDPANVRKRVLKPAAVRAGLGVWKIENGKRHPDSWVGFHTLRHTCATLLFASGWNAKQVQRWLGHHKASFTIDCYVHLLEDGMPEPLPFGDGAYTIRTQTGRNEPKPGLRDAAE